jgi:hypothetical protein
MNRACRYLLLAAISLAPALPSAAAQPAATAGQHDFDFGFGTWTSRIRRLQKPLTGSTTWTESTGTVTVRKLWNGRGQLEEIEVDSPAGHLEGLTVRLYNPASRQWNLYWSNASRGVLTEPAGIGEFKDGRGEFYDQEVYEGKTILVRQIYFDIKPDFYRYEQSFSADGGKTWEPNWVAEITRAASIAKAPETPERSHDFDFSYGKSKTHISRLSAFLSGSKKWLEYDGTSEVTPVWNGRANLLEVQVEGPAGKIEGIGLRLYDPNTHRWSLNWASSKDGVMGVPTVGEFKNGRGDFIDIEQFNGRQIFVRHSFSDITPKSSRFEQAFSADGGKTWETNWVMTMQRNDDA